MLVLVRAKITYLYNWVLSSISLGIYCSYSWRWDLYNQKWCISIQPGITARATSTTQLLSHHELLLLSSSSSSSLVTTMMMMMMTCVQDSNFCRFPPLHFSITLGSAPYRQSNNGVISRSTRSGRRAPYRCHFRIAMYTALPWRRYLQSGWLWIHRRQLLVPLWKVCLYGSNGQTIGYSLQAVFLL